MKKTLCHKGHGPFRWGRARSARASEYLKYLVRICETVHLRKVRITTVRRGITMDHDKTQKSLNDQFSTPAGH